MATGLLGLAAGTMSNFGCGGGGGGTGTAGHGGSGGSAAGTTGHGGSAGSTAGTGGGAAGTTGHGGTGGATAGTGGATAGTGGATAGTGGGAAGTGGGAAGTGGGSSLPCPLDTFATDNEGFSLNIYNATAGNLALLEGGAQATLSHSATEGDPDAGSLKVDAPFTAYNEFVDLTKGFTASTLKNWSGTKLHVRVKVSGGNPSSNNPMGVQPYISSTTGYHFCGPWNNLVSGGGWNDYVLDLSTCTTPSDPSMVIGYGVEILTGDGSNGDGGTNPQPPVAATIYVDSFYLEGSCPGSTGTGGAGGANGGAGGAAAGHGGSGGAAGGSAGASGGSGGAAGGSAGAGGSA